MNRLLRRELYAELLHVPGLDVALFRLKGKVGDHLLPVEAQVSVAECRGQSGLGHPWPTLADHLVDFVSTSKLRDHCSPKSAIHSEFLSPSWENTTRGERRRRSEQHSSS